MNVRAFVFGCILLIGPLGACSDEGTPSNGTQPGGGTVVGSGGQDAQAATDAGMPAAQGDSGRASPDAGTGIPATGGGPSGTAGAAMDGGAGSSAADGGAGTSTMDGGTPGAGSGCTRELLKSTTDAYFRALAAHDPSSLALADNVKFTENGELLPLGQEGLWKTAGTLKYAHSALDTETCTAVSEAVVPDGTLDIPLALRLKLLSQKITEIETIAVRPGDYKVGGSDFRSNTGAIISAAETVGWEQPVPAAQRNTREQIASWIEKYFKMFPRGVCNVTSSCRRLENGGGSFSCSLGASCAAGAPGAGAGVLVPRLIVVDVETGIGVGFTMFMGNTDMHMVKMYGGEVHAVHTILGAAASSGWD